MDSFEFNKIAAAILIALITIKGADLISERLIYPVIPMEHAFKIDGVSEQAVRSAEQPKGPAPIEPLLAQADLQKGEQIFKKCLSCHTIESGGPNRVGPNLHNIVGADKAKHPGFSYSPAMTAKGGKWTYDDLNVYLYNPRHFVPGTKMAFVGVKDDQERADLIAYLKQNTDNPPPVPEAKASSDPIANATKSTDEQPSVPTSGQNQISQSSSPKEPSHE